MDLDAFLKNAGWENAKKTPVAADFSSRRFFRLTREDLPQKGRAIAMQAAPDQKTETFVALSALLRGLGLAAPEILAAKPEEGFALMEDFGDAKIGPLLDAGADPTPFDDAAVSLLARLHERFDPTCPEAASLPHYDASLFAEQTTLFLDFAFPLRMGRPATSEERTTFIAAWRKTLAPLDSLPQSLLLRDFMPDNAMVLSPIVLGETFGIIDFQDAGVGPIAYDLASWCEDVRRDGGLTRLPSLVRAYVAKRGKSLNEPALLEATRLCAAARHVRLLGLVIKLGKTALFERIRKAFFALLLDKGLEPVRHWFSVYAAPLAPVAETGMVLAAGFGLRLRPLTLTTPKPLLEVGGRTMLDWAIDRLKETGVRQVVVNTHYLGERLTAHCATRGDVEIALSPETELLETGGGVKHALRSGTLNVKGRPFFVIAGDLPLENGPPGEGTALERLAARWDPWSMDVLLLVSPREKARGFSGTGDFLLKENGALVRAHVDVADRQVVFLSAMLVTPALYDEIENAHFSNNRIFDLAETRGRLFGLLHNGESFHVGTPDDLKAATLFFATGHT